MAKQSGQTLIMLYVFLALKVEIFEEQVVNTYAKKL
jgi:hypothetical protein